MTDLGIDKALRMVANMLDASAASADEMAQFAAVTQLPDAPSPAEVFRGLAGLFRSVLDEAFDDEAAVEAELKLDDHAAWVARVRRMITTPPLPGGTR